MNGKVSGNVQYLPVTGSKEVIEDNLWFRVQQFLDWRKESNSIDIRLDAILRLK